ncbi:MAG TPA: RraA family protein [Armatimonadetes bacterium]|nr:RraA family protein [Armatimonadota bacterium]
MFEEWLPRLAALPTAALSDVMRRRGMDPGTMHSSMKPVWEGAEVCGPAFTARTYPGATHASGLALSQACPGDVVVLAGCGHTEAILWGEIFSTAAKQQGLGGTVIDGAARDIAGIRELGYPVFARAVTPRGGTGDSQQSETQIPIQCAGIVVHPGDLVRGDSDGVVVIPAALASEIITETEAFHAREERILKFLREGVPLGEACRRAAE